MFSASNRSSPAPSPAPSGKKRPLQGDPFLDEEASSSQDSKRSKLDFLPSVRFAAVAVPASQGKHPALLYRTECEKDLCWPFQWKRSNKSGEVYLCSSCKCKAVHVRIDVYNGYFLQDPARLPHLCEPRFWPTETPCIPCVHWILEILQRNMDYWHVRRNVEQVHDPRAPKYQRSRGLSQLEKEFGEADHPPLADLLDLLRCEELSAYHSLRRRFAGNGDQKRIRSHLKESQDTIWFKMTTFDMRRAAIDMKKEDICDYLDDMSQYLSRKSI